MGKKIFGLILGVTLLVFPAVPGGWTQSARDVDTSVPDLGDAVTRDFTPDVYQGVISANMAGGDVAHELLVDFGVKGVWWFGGLGGPWYKVTSDDPETMKALNIDIDASIEVAVDFGAKGLWLFEWTTGPSWIRLTGDDPEQMIAVDDDDDGVDELQVDFGSKGVWRYDITNGWKKLTNDDPWWGIRCDMWDAGWEEGLWAFSPSGGSWSVYQGFTGNTLWDKLTNDYFYDDSVSAEFGIGDDSEELILDFSSLGTWGYDSDTNTWSKLTSESMFDIHHVKFVGAPDYELLVVFNGVAGVWMWNASGGAFPGTWTKLTNDTPTQQHALVPFDPDGLTELTGDEEVAIDFGTKGLYLYNYTGGTKWRKLTNDSPQFMVRSDLAGDGVDTTLICDFGAKGLWYYYGPTGVWTRLTGDSPDGTT